jgi:hypothetical protein
LEKASYPNQILAGNVFDRQAPLLFEHLGQSQTYVHNQVFVTMAYFDIVVDRVEHLGPVTISHMTKALSLLQTDLASIDRATTEVTISTIVAFSMVAFLSGDTDSAGKHLQGLFKVLTIRGGLSSLKNCSYLQIKCCRSVVMHLVTNIRSTYSALDLILVMLCALAQNPFSLQPIIYPGNRTSQEAYQCPESLRYTS